jgi:predicted nuclease of predicted toxin-antitoxin system
LRVQATNTGPRVVWLRVGNTSNAALRAWFVPRVPQIVALLAQGTRLVEIR